MIVVMMVVEVIKIKKKKIEIKSNNLSYNN